MRVRSALVYTVLRLAAFFVPFGIMMLIPIMREYYWLSAIFAALIGLSLSMLFLRRPLDDLTADLGARRTRRVSVSDEDAEDAATGDTATFRGDGATDTGNTATADPATGEASTDADGRPVS